jgi:hypothetical protein
MMTVRGVTIEGEGDDDIVDNDSGDVQEDSIREYFFF